ncbi:MAG: MYXO-CTERM sorting domain-containing protein [Myxococcota bacterium]
MRTRPIATLTERATPATIVWEWRIRRSLRPRTIPGCGCSTASPVGAIALFGPLMLLLGARRRRARSG